MAIAFDSAASGGGYPPNGISVSHSLGYGSGNNRLLVVAVVSLGPSPHTVTSATYNGVAMTLIHQENSPTYFGRMVSVEYYGLLDASLPASSGSYTASLTVTGPYGGCIGVASYTGVDQTTFPSNHAQGNNFNNPPLSGQFSTSITVAGSAGILLDAAGIESSDTAAAFTPGSGQTERVDYSYGSNPQLVLSDKPFTSSGSNSMAQTPDQSYWAYAHAVLEVLEAGGGPVAEDNATLMGLCF